MYKFILAAVLSSFDLASSAQTVAPVAPVVPAAPSATPSAPAAAPAEKEKVQSQKESGLIFQASRKSPAVQGFFLTPNGSKYSCGHPPIFYPRTDLAC
ncbi:MAG: hypothetical protein EBR17_07150 [Betaproteobacteria bacterium]|nr:hypothetical protein [Betaproteobacteria bacterium]